MMNTSKVIIKAGFGTYNSLDKKYNKYVNKHFINGDDNVYERWLTYDLIIKELINLDKLNCFEEIKYRITGGENPNEVFLDIVNKNTEVKNNLLSLTKRLELYRDEDLLNIFYP